MSVLGEFIAQIFAGAVPDWFGHSFMSRRSSAAARRHLANEGRLSSAIRAVEGRPLNIGVEWSTGIAELSPAHVRFVPRMGIVGVREIDVLKLAETERPIPPVPVTTSPATVLRLTSSKGDLYWLVATDLVREVFARVQLGDPSSDA